MVTSTQTEKRLVWHPRGDNKFVVGGGSQIILYEWTPDFPEIRHVTSQHDLQFMKCFAWSPDPSVDDLMAIGLSTGRVDLIRLEATKFAQHPNLLSSGPTVTLPPRHSRSCNTVAFCTVDPNYLAVGLDKVRGEPSLVIWDISSTSPTLSVSAKIPNNGSLTAPSRPQPQIPRVDSGPRMDSRVLQQHAQTEVVSSLAFLPKSTNILLAGISYRWLRLFDLRNPIPSTTNIAAKVHGLATDPFDEHRFGCFGDGVASIWDARKLTNPLLTFTERDALADGARIRSNGIYSCIEFSSVRRGTLATLERDGTYVRFWDTMQAQILPAGEPSETNQSRDSSVSTRSTRKSWANLSWAAGGMGLQTHSSSKESETQPALMSCDTRRTKEFPRPLASFALVPSPHHYPLTSNVMVVNREGDLELYAVHDTPKQAAWSSRGELVIGAGQSLRLVPGYSQDSPLPEPWDVLPQNSYNQATSAKSRSQSRQESSTGGHYRLRGDNAASSSPALFGRGDEDGFPALSANKSASLTSTSFIPAQSAKGRAHSPIALRNLTYQFEYSGGPKVDSEPKSRQSRQDGSARGRSGRREPQDSSSRTRRQHPLKALAFLVEDDIAMIMRTRPQYNASITQDDPERLLAETWGWISHAKNVLCNPTARLYGYDFQYEGLLGVWEGFPPMPHHPDAAPSSLLPPDLSASHSSRHNRSLLTESHSKFQAALIELASRTSSGIAIWKPTVSTAKLIQRQIALDLCGWSLKEEDLNNAVKRWEKEGKISRAACWLVFTRQYGKALELLMRSDDETHHMMSGTLAALTPHNTSSSRSIDLREHCERLIVKLHDPYFRAMLTHLTLGDWLEVLEEEVLPFRERLAIAFQFLDDKSLSSYLWRCTERSTSQGHIDGLIVTGLTKPGMDILQAYIDHSGDIQTAAIFGSYVCPSKFTDHRVDRWVESYRDLLDGFKLFHHRVNFDIERGQIRQEAIQNGDIPPTAEWVSRQIFIRCNYCNKSVNLSRNSVQQKTQMTACPNCNRSLPRCSICLMALGIVQDSVREVELSRTPYRDTIDDAIVICQTCRHGGHASHILDWFFGSDGTRSHVCAVADCECRCSEEF